MLSGNAGVAIRVCRKMIAVGEKVLGVCSYYHQGRRKSVSGRQKNEESNGW